MRGTEVLALASVVCAFVAASGGARADTLWDYEAVDALGCGTHARVNAVPGDDNRVVLEGLVIGGSRDFTDPDGAFAMYSIWLADDGDVKGGMQCWAGPWNKAGGWDAYPEVAAGSRVRVTGWLADHNGKVFMNDRHSTALLWTVEVLDNDAGMPAPQVIPSVASCNFFDASRVGGGELWQTRWVTLEDVEIVGGTAGWGPDGEVIISDTGGLDNLVMKLSVMGDFDLHAAPTGKFDVVGLFDQEDTNGDGDFHDGYRIWVKTFADITPVPEPATWTLTALSAALAAFARRRAGRRSSR
jgi:hypothetical protein